MIKKRLQRLLFFTILIIASCNNKSDETIYKTQSGEYASKTGNFIAAFPIEPNYTSIDNQIGLDKFQIHQFRSALGPNKIFLIEYIDYPEYMIKSMTDEQLFSQGITNLSNKMEQAFKLGFQEPIEQHGLKGQYFVLNLKQSALDKGIKGNLLGKLFRKGNRVYSVTYMGQNDNNTDTFMKSFRLINN